MFGALFHISVTEEPQAHTAMSEPEITVIIDAGHGGEDSGAVVNGLIEKDINLPIALKLRDMLVASGYRVVMTRDSDISIYDSTASTVREKKVSDMKNREKIINSSEKNILISIHQNKFEQSKYSGAQIFYSGNNENSVLLAEEIRKSVTSLLQPYNRRELKKDSGSIYILKKAKVPAVIVECGFLSNLEEGAKLADEKYQSEMAFAIYCGFLQYSSKSE